MTAGPTATKRGKDDTPPELQDKPKRKYVRSSKFVGKLDLQKQRQKGNKSERLEQPAGVRQQRQNAG